jgi:hypothetical protein
MRPTVPARMAQARLLASRDVLFFFGFGAEKLKVGSGGQWEAHAQSGRFLVPLRSQKKIPRTFFK